MDKGVRIKNIPAHSPFCRIGLKKGDRIKSVNGEEISDELDFRFFAADNLLSIIVERDRKVLRFLVERNEGEFLDLEFYENPINRCVNHCIFCFIDQMPPGLRKNLYIKDEDFKYSFLNGNYVTLSGASSKDLEKVVKLGISPLYISVHATDTAVRNKMLGNRKAPSIMEQLKFLKKSGVRFHTQIVVCRGYNDGPVLHKTVKDLFSFKDSLLSVAVVPVGLTRFRKIQLQEFERQSALSLCREITRFSDEFALRSGTRKLFLADEFFIKAGLSIPVKKYYEDYPQIENGVGLVRQLQEEWKSFKRKMRLSGPAKRVKVRKLLVLTSISAYPFINAVLKEGQKLIGNLDLAIIPVINQFFGEKVTVAGLLTAEDVIRTVRENCNSRKNLRLILPGAMFNYANYTLDGFSAERIGKMLSMKVVVADSLEDVFLKSG